MHLCPQKSKDIVTIGSVDFAIYQENRGKYGRNEKRIETRVETDDWRIGLMQSTCTLDKMDMMILTGQPKLDDAPVISRINGYNSEDNIQKHTWRPTRELYLDLWIWILALTTQVNLRQSEEDLKGLCLALTVDALEGVTGEGIVSDFTEFKAMWKSLSSKSRSVSQKILPGDTFELSLERMMFIQLDIPNIIPSGGITCLVAQGTERSVLWQQRRGMSTSKISTCGLKAILTSRENIALTGSTAKWCLQKERIGLLLKLLELHIIWGKLMDEFRREGLSVGHTLPNSKGFRGLSQGSQRKDDCSKSLLIQLSAMHPEERTAAKKVQCSLKNHALHDSLSVAASRSLSKAHTDDQDKKKVWIQMKCLHPVAELKQSASFLPFASFRWASLSYQYGCTRVSSYMETLRRSVCQTSLQVVKNLAASPNKVTACQGTLWPDQAPTSWYKMMISSLGSQSLSMVKDVVNDLMQRVIHDEFQASIHPHEAHKSLGEKDEEGEMLMYILFGSSMIGLSHVLKSLQDQT
ncbi:hypothetical protein Tco_1394017 [Tanacetum coccineum]